MATSEPIQNGRDIGLRIETAQFCRLDNGVDHRGADITAIRTQEQKILSGYGNSSQEALG